MNSDTNLNNQIGQNNNNGVSSIPNLSNVQPVMDNNMGSVTSTDGMSISSSNLNNVTPVMDNVNTVAMGEVNNAGISSGVNSVDNLSNVQPVMDNNMSNVTSADGMNIPSNNLNNVTPVMDNVNTVAMGEVNNVGISSGVNSTDNLSNVQPVMYNNMSNVTSADGMNISSSNLNNVTPVMDNVNTVAIGEVNNAGISNGVNSVDNSSNMQPVMDNNMSNVTSADGMNIPSNNLNFQNDPLTNIQQNLDAIPSNSEINSVPTEGSNDSELQKPKKKHGIFIVLILLVLLAGVGFAVYKFFLAKGDNGSGGIENGATIDQDQELKIGNNFTNIVIKVNDVEKNVTVGDGKFTKIKVTVHNNGDEETNPIMNFFSTVDENGDATSTSGCYDLLFASSYGGMDDAIDMTIPGGKDRTGYLYCDDPDGVAKKLRIVSYTKIDTEAAKEGTFRAIAQDTFYINLD